ncbi:ABC transporter ATP-binding protein [Pigmentiphaga litoralis]|uniref:ABC-type branched-subunit amino acid transport system ATPase component n=1 Tax=Pigmentiphaga litoralis TaxID=516702 RepID=A0A7Y9IY87_9BURK|nr:ABC transporter ATP-binding protein [Pigmentiphaga litoralis]NYE21732.1 ABC-type branched-subunit amino acid transport system ATPase component [Pigmentiphaga litoralis]NYE84653.1 ABC-type branched-subunit amino acid transport system ATPase component [Pigmentiphaga litoralis]
MIATRHLHKRFGGFTATNDLTFRLEPGSRHALIGPNGAGKTTLINLLTGMLQPTSGDVLLGDVLLNGMRPEARVKLGLVRTFQINTLFLDMTPLEAVSLVIMTREGATSSLFGSLRKQGPAAREALALLDRMGLRADAHRLTRHLPYGRQRLIEIALALARKPKVLLLDEPAAGVPSADSKQVFQILDELPKDVSILLIEHDMRLVFRFAQQISVLVGGALVASGTPDAIASNPRVREVYLGQTRLDTVTA